MSYHTSGSMGSFGGGYGTIEIALNQTDNLVKGNQYNYNIYTWTKWFIFTN